MRASTQPTVRYAHPRRTRLHDRPVPHRARPRGDLRRSRSSSRCDQFPALCGERGLEPATARSCARSRFLDAPEPLPLAATRTGGCGPSRGSGSRSRSLLVLGLPQRGAAAGHDARLVRALGRSTSRSSTSAARSTASAGRSLLLEAGFLAIFLGNADDRAAVARDPRVPLARVPGRVRGGADQAPRRPLLARPDVHGLPPRDAADAEPARAGSSTTCRGRCTALEVARQLRRPAGRCRSGCSCRSRSRPVAARR